MKIKRICRRKPYVPTASFGDIAFLLIIFFMVTSVFMREKHIEVYEAKAVEVEKIAAKTISVVVDVNGEIWLQGDKCPFDALGPSISVLLEGNKEKVVMVKIDKDQSQENFGKVLLAVSSAGADIALLGQKDRP